jgi:serine protease Do
MRKNIVAIVLATFVGVFGALQLDHFVSQHADRIPFMNSKPSDGGLFDVAYHGPTLSPAPFDFAAAAKKVSPSVVSVDRFDQRTDLMGDDLGSQKSGTGSGVIISDSGLIVTNNHVVAHANRVMVRMNDGRSFDAKVLGTDARADLALIQVPAKNLTPIEIGTSSDAQVGQWVMAVGNPLDLGDTVTVGVVSSLNRDLPVGSRGLIGAIQTDAAINPGNSGGALCNAQGQLIGINAAIESPTGENIGIGFAIPVDRVKSVVNDIEKFGYVKYAGLGISYNPQWDGVLASDDLRGQLAQLLGVAALPDHGVVVTSSTGGAESAGIAKNDVIEAIDGTSVNNTLDLNKATIARKPGDKVKVTLWSHGSVSTKNVVLQELPRQDN